MAFVEKTLENFWRSRFCLATTIKPIQQNLWKTLKILSFHVEKQNQEQKINDKFKKNLLRGCIMFESVL